MENLEELLKKWKAIPPTYLAVDAIKTDAGLQFRSEDAVPMHDRYGQSRASKEQKLRLLDMLRSGKEPDLDPVLVAEIAGEYWMVDGHHRLDAYRKLNRAIPACILVTDMRSAVGVATLVNLGNVKQGLHPAQGKECAWQYTGVMTGHGTKRPPKGYTRDLPDLFPGVSRNTVNRMGQRAMTIKLADYPSDECNPLTGWPTWAAVKRREMSERVGDGTQMSLKARCKTQMDKKAHQYAFAILKMNHENPGSLYQAFTWLKDGFCEGDLDALDGDVLDELGEAHVAMAPKVDDEF